MVNIKFTTDFFLRYSAFLADVPISLAGRGRLLCPIGAIVGYPSTFPSPMIFPAEPSCTRLARALAIAKVFFRPLNAVFGAFQHLATGGTRYFHAVKLGMIRAGRGVTLSSPFGVTLPGTEAVSALGAKLSQLPLELFPALFTHKSYDGSFRHDCFSFEPSIITRLEGGTQN